MKSIPRMKTCIKCNNIYKGRTKTTSKCLSCMSPKFRKLHFTKLLREHPIEVLTEEEMRYYKEIKKQEATND